MEHENLISDSEYITLSHQTDDATTHIQTTALKQRLDGLYNFLEQLYQAIESGGFSRSTIQVFSDTNFTAYKHRVQTSEGILSTLSFQCYNAAETVLTGELKEELEKFVGGGKTISNGAISISNDGSTMKLINSSPSENVTQHATFTFDEGVILE